MRGSLFLFSILLITVFSCSSTKHTVIPYNGFVFKTDERVLVHMLDRNYNYHSKLSREVLQQLQTCQGTFLSYEDTRDKLFSHLVTFDKVLIQDTTTLARLSKTIDADYLLTGGYLDSSKKGAVRFDISEENNQNYGNIEKPWSELHFVLVDLHSYKTALKLIVKTTSQSTGIPTGGGTTTKVYVHKEVKMKKALNILSKTFHCN